MIGPGTGVAPFIGFLEHLYLSSKSIDGFDVNNLNTWLFYGCRHRQHDFLFEYLNSLLLHFFYI
jgi:methionine synthase reductase